MNPFRALDERVLPRLGRGLARLIGLDRSAGFPVVAAVVVLCVLVAGSLAVWGGTRAVPVDDTVGEVARVGVVDGQSIPAYVDASWAELEDTAAGAVVWALVGFDAYAEPAALDSMLAGYQVGRVIARVPLPGVQTQIVTLVVDTLGSDVPAGMRRVAAQKRKAAAASPVGAREGEAREADAYAQLCACLYAAVVRATGARLEALAERPGVRVIDPAPEVTRLDRAVFVPPLPEQRTVVEPPDTGPAPTDPAKPSDAVGTPWSPEPSR